MERRRTRRGVRVLVAALAIALAGSGSSRATTPRVLAGGTVLVGVVWQVHAVFADTGSTGQLSIFSVRLGSTRTIELDCLSLLDEPEARRTRVFASGDDPATGRPIRITFVDSADGLDSFEYNPPLLSNPCGAPSGLGEYRLPGVFVVTPAA